MRPYLCKLLASSSQSRPLFKGIRIFIPFHKVENQNMFIIYYVLTYINIHNNLLLFVLKGNDEALL